MLSSGVTKKILPNGLTVLVKEKKATNVAAIFTYVKAGYFNESDRLVGISHLIEHMFFKGTRKRGVGEIARETKALGGFLNASTIYDHTLYYTVLPSDQLAQGLDIQSDALIYSIFDPKELKKETEVVIQEARRKMDMPASVSTEKLFELAFDRHRIRRWRIGTEEGLRALDRDDFLEFHKNLYRPENVILAVVGDIDTGAALTQIEKYYGDFEKAQVLKEESPTEPPQRDFKYHAMQGDINQCYLKMAFRTPDILHEDIYAVEILAFILGQGRSSQLYQDVKETKKLVDSISVYNYAFKDLGVFVVDATCRAENLREAEKAIVANIQKLKDAPVKSEELIKARNSLESSFLSTMESAAGQASLFANYEALGDYRLVDDYLNKLWQVGQADILRAARKYLQLSRCSLLEYIPKESNLPAMETRQMREQLENTTTKSRATHSGPAMAPAGEGLQIHIPENGLVKEVQRLVLPNGLTLLLKENHQIPKIAVGLYARQGRARENVENAGISGLTIQSSLKGTSQRNAKQIAFEAEKLGSSLAISNDPDYMGYSTNLLTKYFDEGWHILTDVIKNPVFPKEEVEKEKANIFARLLREKDDMFRYPVQLYYSALFGTHPYGLPGTGREEAIRSLSTDDLLSWHRLQFHPGNMVLAFVGDVDPEKIMEWVERDFGEWHASVSEKDSATEIAAITEVTENIEERNKEQTALALGFSVPEYTNEAYFPLTVLQNIVSGLGGRFFEELRGRQSLAYTVASFLVARALGGTFISYIATSPENEERAKTGLLQELGKLTKEPVSKQELQESTQYTIGTYRIALETNRAQMAHYVHNEILGKPFEELERVPDRMAKVTQEDILQTMQTYFDANRYALGMVRGKSRSS